MISFVHIELEVTLEMDHVVYSDDNLFSLTRNWLADTIFFVLCATYTENFYSNSQCILFAKNL